MASRASEGLFRSDKERHVWGLLTGTRIGEGNSTRYWQLEMISDSGPPLCIYFPWRRRGASWPLDKWVLDGWIVAPQLVMPRFQCCSTCVGTLWGSPRLISLWDEPFYTSGRAVGYYRARLLVTHLSFWDVSKGCVLVLEGRSSGMRWRLLIVVMETSFQGAHVASILF